MIRNAQNFFFLFLIVGCVRHQNESVSVVETDFESARVSIKYAEGFEVKYADGYVKVTTRSLVGNESFSDSIFILDNADIVLGDYSKKIGNTGTKLACQSSTHLAFLNVLNDLDQVVGLCGMEYVNNPVTSEILEKNDVVELCLADQVQLEAVHQSNAGLFLVYPFGGGQTEAYQEKGIQTLLIAEYLEKSQLARLEWIKLFGLITGHVNEANQYFEEVASDYLTLKSSAVQSERTFIMNLPFSDQWFMPSSKSVGVQLIEDAGIQYFYQNTSGTENIVHSNEQVWEDGIAADYWVIIARRPSGFSLSDLLAEAPVYREFKSVKNNQVIFCNTAETEYFSQGVVEPNVILKDLLFATGQIEAHTPTYFFRLE